MNHHLANFRIGWQGEALADYILSKFAFIAKPHTIGDDIGIDVICTVFQREEDGGREYLVPGASFVLQIKSSNNTFDITSKLKYLKQLELPFFVGVVDESSLNLNLYSGEHLPHFLAYEGSAPKTKVKLCDDNIASGTWKKLGAKAGFSLSFPLLTSFGAADSTKEVLPKVEVLRSKVESVQCHVAAMRNHEYTFETVEQETGSRRIDVFAGDDSLPYFRKNLLKRLGEAFWNMQVMQRNHPADFDRLEFESYERILSEIQAIAMTPDEAYWLGWVKDARTRAAQEIARRCRRPRTTRHK